MEYAILMKSSSTGLLFTVEIWMYKGGGGVRRRREGGGESCQDCENLKSKQTLYVRGVLFLILGESLLHPTTNKLRTRPTPCSGLPPDNLEMGPVLGPEYLLSDVERAIIGQLKLVKVYAVPLLIKTFTS